MWKIEVCRNLSTFAGKLCRIGKRKLSSRKINNRFYGEERNCWHCRLSSCLISENVTANDFNTEKWNSDWKRWQWKKFCLSKVYRLPKEETDVYTAPTENETLSHFLQNLVPKYLQQIEQKTSYLEKSQDRCQQFEKWPNYSCWRETWNLCRRNMHGIFASCINASRQFFWWAIHIIWWNKKISENTHWKILQLTPYINFGKFWKINNTKIYCKLVETN